ncbi:MAG: acyl-ACP--UDP-N-acetylglucosamine O-acyltransferase [Akkermansiaceae bacterium]|nr:acyl-ACP--UDP-N-acetylglucosamine O-acyltransferase [Akkermansiaceae bacterium]
MPNIHPTALISPEAELAEDVTVGPFAVIDGPVKLAAGVSIGGHAHLTGKTEIGESSRIGWGCIVGADPQDLHFNPATDSGVVIGARNVLREYVTIHRGTRDGGVTRMGDDNFLMTGVHLAHDVSLGDGNIFANNVLLAGHVQVGNKTFLGGGAAFHQFIKIGDLAMSQGLTIVSQDVPPYCVVNGVNQLVGLNVVGLRRAGLDLATRNDLKKAYKFFFLSGKLRQAALEEAEGGTWTPEARKFIDALANPSRKGVAAP